MRQSSTLLVSVALIAMLALACTPRPAGGPPAASSGAAQPPPDLAFTVPLGTFAADTRGEPIFSLPSTIHVVAGQSISVRNEDQAMHYFFDVPIAPGQTFRKTFNRPGTFGYSPGLSCSLAQGGSVTIEVSAP